MIDIPSLTFAVVKNRIEVRHKLSKELVFRSRELDTIDTADQMMERIAHGFAGTEEVWTKKSYNDILKWFKANPAVYTRWQKALFSVHCNRDTPRATQMPESAKSTATSGKRSPKRLSRSKRKA